MAASIGRFIQPDTLIPDLYDPQSLNRYSYVRNNPVRNTDPTGHIAPAIALVFANPVFDAVLVGAVVYYAYVGPTYMYGPNAQQNRDALSDSANSVIENAFRWRPQFWRPDPKDKNPAKNRNVSPPPAWDPPKGDQKVNVNTQGLGKEPNTWILNNSGKPDCGVGGCWKVGVARTVGIAAALCVASRICVQADEGETSVGPESGTPATRDDQLAEPPQQPSSGGGSQPDKDSDSDESTSVSNPAPPPPPDFWNLTHPYG